LLESRNAPAKVGIVEIVGIPIIERHNQRPVLGLSLPQVLNKVAEPHRPANFSEYFKLLCEVTGCYAERPWIGVYFSHPVVEQNQSARHETVPERPDDPTQSFQSTDSHNVTCLVAAEPH